MYECDSIVIKNIVVELVLQGYREIQEGKGIDGEEFFKEFEQRYSK